MERVKREAELVTWLKQDNVNSWWFAPDGTHIADEAPIIEVNGDQGVCVGCRQFRQVIVLSCWDDQAHSSDWCEPCFKRLAQLVGAEILRNELKRQGR